MLGWPTRALDLRKEVIMKQDISIKSFLYFILGISFKKDDLAPKVRKVKKISSDNKRMNLLLKENSNQLLRRIVLTITWFLIIAFIVSLAAIIYISLLGAETPPVLLHIITATLGYLGGVISSFMRFMIPDNTDE